MFGGVDPIRHAGNQALFRALDLSILSTLIGLPLHVHAEGLRGTGKTTIMRSVKRRLPRIQRIKGCVFNCLPWAPHCPHHRGLTAAEVRVIGTEWVPMPFKEISHSAKVGTVAGSIDLARIADRGRPEVALLPGTLPQAHRGIIFVDEVNRLADTAPELADILLDVMGTKPGRLQVEETGLPSVDLPISVSVWAASNPDEDPGPLEDIRKQLSDRFDFVIAMERPSAVDTVRDILRSSRERHLALAEVPAWAAADGEAAGGVEVATGTGRVNAAAATGVGDAAGASVAEPAAEQAQPATGLARPQPSLGDWARLAEAVRCVECPAAVDELIASLYIDFGLESLRGVEAIHHGARMNCVLEGRGVITFGDIAAVAPGALQHRLDVSTFARVIDHLAQMARAQDGLDAEAAAREADAGGRDGSGAEAGAASPGGASGAAAAGPAGAQRTGAPERDSAPPDGCPGSGGPGDPRWREPASGWQSLWSRFGRRQRVSEAGAAPGQGRSGQAASGKGLDEGLGGREGGAASGSASSRSGQGGQGGPGERQRERDDPAVAPLHAARPLAEILREMELGGLEPPFPRVP